MALIRQPLSLWTPQNTLAVEELRAMDFIFFNLLFERSSNFCLNDPTGSHHENIQHRGLFDYFCLHAGLYVFRPYSIGTLDWNVDRRSLFYLLLVSRRVVFCRCSSFWNRSLFPRL